jgi:hypothetical protein
MSLYFKGYKLACFLISQNVWSRDANPFWGGLAGAMKNHLEQYERIPTDELEILGKGSQG